MRCEVSTRCGPPHRSPALGGRRGWAAIFFAGERYEEGARDLAQICSGHGYPSDGKSQVQTLSGYGFSWTGHSPVTRLQSSSMSTTLADERSKIDIATDCKKLGCLPAAVCQLRHRAGHSILPPGQIPALNPAPPRERAARHRFDTFGTQHITLRNARGCPIYRELRKTIGLPHLSVRPAHAIEQSLLWASPPSSSASS